MRAFSSSLRRSTCALIRPPTSRSQGDSRSLRSSGLSVKEFCVRKLVSNPSLYQLAQEAGGRRKKRLWEDEGQGEACVSIGSCDVGCGGVVDRVSFLVAFGSVCWPAISSWFAPHPASIRTYRTEERRHRVDRKQRRHCRSRQAAVRYGFDYRPAPTLAALPDGSRAHSHLFLPHAKHHRVTLAEHSCDPTTSSA